MENSYSLPKKTKTKVIVLAGFLGAGKTTLLQRILSWETDLSGTVVIVNEFGAVGIDGSLLADAGSDVVELTSGCVCCSLQADLTLTLKKIRQQFNPGRIILEATGVADPRAIVDVFQDAELQEYMAVDKIITVLDADFWEVRECLGTLFFSQLRDADLILLNKIDTVEHDRVPFILKELHETTPGSQVIPTIQCGVDPESLWTVGRRNDCGPNPGRFFQIVTPDPGHDHRPDHSDSTDHGSAGTTRQAVAEEKSHYVAFSFSNSAPLDENCFKRFTEKLPWELFRMKGPVRFHDHTALVNYVGGKCGWADWSGAQETRLAFVGWEVDGQETIGKLKNCIAPA
ncbi:MAG: GTP-binding protein [bacterium]|nr:GTP-binding protein [bacterium]